MALTKSYLDPETWSWVGYQTRLVREKTEDYEPYEIKGPSDV